MHILQDKFYLLFITDIANSPENLTTRGFKLTMHNLHEHIVFKDIAIDTY